MQACSWRHYLLNRHEMMISYFTLQIEAGHIKSKLNLAPYAGVTRSWTGSDLWIEDPQSQEKSLMNFGLATPVVKSLIRTK